MIGDYVLHFPLTDFAVSLLVVAALIDGGRLVLARPHWSTAVDLLLVLGFAGAIASVATGLWLTSAGGHPHTRSLEIHHWFAYGTLGTAGVSVIARLLQRRSAKLAVVKTGTLFVSAVLVSGAGFFGGQMAHGGDPDHAHGASTAGSGDHVMQAPDEDAPPASTPKQPEKPHSEPHSH